MRTIIFIPSIGWKGWAGLTNVWVGGALVALLTGWPVGYALQGCAVGAAVMYVVIRAILLGIIRDENMTEAETIEEAMNADPHKVGPAPTSQRPFGEGVQGEAPPALDEQSKVDAMRERARWN